MLSLRSVVFAALGAVALWGLFELLDTLREPGLLRTEKAAVIKGCESLDSDETRAVCPQLFCQKAVIDTKRVPYTTRFAVTVDKNDGAAARLIGGDISERAPNDQGACFVCVMQNNKVTAVKVTNRATLDELAEQAGGWKF
jgi:hypothetical protein